MLVLTTAFALMASTTAATAHKQAAAVQSEDEAITLDEDASADENFEGEEESLEIVFDNEVDSEIEDEFGEEG